MTRLIAGILLATAGFQAPPAAAGPAPAAYGVWRNPRGTIDVRIAPCGVEVCGTIVRASPEAEKDAREGGTPKLVGVQLLQHYKQVAPDRWEGRVFVPDMGGTYSSHIVKVSPNALRISGCLLGGWLCKTQTWTRQ